MMLIHQRYRRHNPSIRELICHFQHLSNQKHAGLPFICRWDLFKCLIQGAQPRWKMAPTVLSTRITLRLEGRPSRSASQKIWSSAGWRKQKNQSPDFQTFLFLFRFFWFNIHKEMQARRQAEMDTQASYACLLSGRLTQQVVSMKSVFRASQCCGHVILKLP